MGTTISTVRVGQKPTKEVIKRAREAAKVTWAFVDSKGMPTKIPPEFDVPGLKP
ncbi:MAG: hypothetical protein FWD28_10220 [Treponema sp.]|nr:hypothetical protein [Treponema sp.]